jgi:trk system potassium uptake protein TrkH
MSKLVFRGFYRRVHSRSVRAIKIGDRAISGKMVSGITSFALLFLGIFVGTAVVLSLQGLDMSSTLSAAASLLTTMGSGFGVIGPSGDYSMFCAPLKLFMSLIMIVGRLELFSVFLLFMPEFWDPNKAKLR